MMIDNQSLTGTAAEGFRDSVHGEIPRSDERISEGNSHGKNAYAEQYDALAETTNERNPINFFDMKQTVLPRDGQGEQP